MVTLLPDVPVPVPDSIIEDFLTLYAVSLRMWNICQEIHSLICRRSRSEVIFALIAASFMNQMYATVSK